MRRLSPPEIEPKVRRRGRPSIALAGEPTTTVDFKFSVIEYELLKLEAARRETTVSELIRRAVRELIARERQRVP